MSHLFKWYRWIDVLSLDVAAGATACAYYFSTLFSVDVNPISLIVLGLSVWIIYTADHLKDVSRMENEATTLRHKFHQQHFKSLLISITIAGIVIVIMLLYLDKYTLLWGLKLSVAVLIYLILNHFLSFAKEIIGGLLYCLGILLPTLSQLEFSWSFIMRYEVLIFGLLVITNLFLFSSNELNQDVQDNHKSFAMHFGKSITLGVVKSLITIVIVILLLGWSHLELHSRIIFISMVSVLIAITIFPGTFKKHDRYRYWGDLIFLFPAIALML